MDESRERYFIRQTVVGVEHPARSLFTRSSSLCRRSHAYLRLTFSISVLGNPAGLFQGVKSLVTPPPPAPPTPRGQCADATVLNSFSPSIRSANPLPTLLHTLLLHSTQT
ncbi:hypothetical protein EJ06DRAFT_396360 [Trichodelitschia bisporula]|uniref:Uncharacterized protein n=1 Tax=Trichodelitschia bisporula TaxID=703511 RepID=A0A6G1I038_9PEZI|nr:hypothetical protein EJ06DRAFT_396360 [Trichodelitschia bisporula]